MSISGISSFSAASSDVMATQNRQPPSQVFMQQLQTLFDDIQSGDLSAAQQDYSQIESSASTSSSSTASSSDQNDPMSQLLSQVGSALQSGDITSAQSAVTEFQKNAPPPPPSGGAGGMPSGGGQSLTADQQSFRDDFLNLLDAIQTGDQSGAQSALSSLQSMLSASGSSTGTSSTGSSTSTSDSASSSASTSGSSSSTLAPDAVLQLVEQLSKALQSNNMTTASQEVSAFITRMPSGNMVDAMA